MQTICLYLYAYVYVCVCFFFLFFFRKCTKFFSSHFCFILWMHYTLTVCVCVCVYTATHKHLSFDGIHLSISVFFLSSIDIVKCCCRWYLFTSHLVNIQCVEHFMQSPVITSCVSFFFSFSFFIFHFFFSFLFRLYLLKNDE